MKEIAQRISVFKESIFATMSQKANELGAINLSQGFPDFDGPEWLKDLAQNAIQKGPNQYAASPGSINLRNTLSELYKDQYGLTFDPASEITVSNGATEAIFLTILGLVNPGDEVVAFEPFYDSYQSVVEMVGGKLIPVTLNAPDFSFNESELRNAITPKTKMIMLNSPHNPTGKVFNKKELQLISTIAVENDLFVMSDEVYEYLTFDNAEHFPIASFPGMRDRTLTISSGGKTFGFTGWKIGWIMAPEKLSYAVRMVHQYNVFSVSAPIQEAYSKALNPTKLNDYLPDYRSMYSEKRDIVMNGLSDAGFSPVLPQGTYFIMSSYEKLSDKKDMDFCKEIIEERGVATIPPSPFYSKSKEGEHFLRFCFAKTNKILEESMKRIKK